MARIRTNVSRPDAENPKWTPEEVQKAQLLTEVLPKETAEALRLYARKAGLSTERSSTRRGAGAAARRRDRRTASR